MGPTTTPSGQGPFRTAAIVVPDDREQLLRLVLQNKRFFLWCFLGSHNWYYRSRIEFETSSGGVNVTEHRLCSCGKTKTAKWIFDPQRQRVWSEYTASPNDWAVPSINQKFIINQYLADRRLREGKTVIDS